MAIISFCHILTFDLNVEYEVMFEGVLVAQYHGQHERKMNIKAAYLKISLNRLGRWIPSRRTKLFAHIFNGVRWCFSELVQGSLKDSIYGC